MSIDTPQPTFFASRRLWRDALRRLWRNRLALTAFSTLVFLFFASFLGPMLLAALFGVDPLAQDVERGATGPSFAHPFGTDLLGRDLLVRVLYGGRLSLLVGVVATFVSLTIGVAWGAIAGYVGGRVDNWMMRIVDVLYSLPYMFLVILMMVMVRALRTSSGVPDSLLPFLHPTLVLFFGLGAVQWLTMSRIVRGQVLSLKRREFIAAARTIGVRGPSILLRHLIPNTLGPVIVYTTLTVPSVILQEAFLSFLGLGVEAPDASWGTLVNDGARAMVVYPWLLIIPALFLASTIFCLNALGDGLRDALDPQTQKE
jgi:oligopeptide transport system permease protein